MLLCRFIFTGKFASEDKEHLFGVIDFGDVHDMPKVIHEAVEHLFKLTQQSAVDYVDILEGLLCLPEHLQRLARPREIINSLAVRFRF